MAFRIKALFIVLTAVAAFAEVPRVTDDCVVYKTFEWKFDDIQQLTLAPNRIHVLTYEDRKWKLGRDRRYTIEKLPDGFTATLVDHLRAKLDQRLVVALPDPAIHPTREIPAKLLGRIQGTQGTLQFADGWIVFSGIVSGESRTWRYSDIDNIASANPLDFSVVTREREFRFQLKHPLPEVQYNALWRKLNTSKQKDYEHD